jgi:hypothetical protein
VPMIERPRWMRGEPRGWDGLGFDSETHQGWAKLLCTDTESTLVKRGDWKRAFDFLLDQGPRFVAWNLRFDAEAVLKHLGESSLRRLYATESVNLPMGYSVDIVPWKMLRIRREETKSEIFDIAPFFGGKLENAARRFLGVGKLRNVDAARLNVDGEYWRRNLPAIVEYCKRDAKLTNELASLVSERFVTLGGDFRRPFSVAFVAADILMRNARIPKLDERVVAPAEDAFRGARFECLQRGRFDDAHAYDIKSAYPAGLRKVEDSERGRWVRSRKPHRDALHAIIRVRVNVPPDEYPCMAPFPYARSDGSVVYPTGTFETTLLKETYERWEELCEPIATWSYIPEGSIVTPYGEVVDRLLAYREESDELLKDSAKRGNNSLYGKLLNQRAEYRLDPVGAGTDHWAGNVVVIDGEPYKRERVRKKGLLYNPLHAGLTTEHTRLAIWDACAKGREHVLMIQADGIIAKRAFLGTAKAKKAGDLGYVAGGDTIVCGSGLYEIRGYARRTRGVMFHALGENKGGKAKKMKGPSWFGLLRGKKTETVVFDDVRPAHIGECLRGAHIQHVGGGVRALGLKDANVFLPFRRTLNVCRDSKRRWPDIGQARRLLSERFESEPLKLAG